jgi:hypothetical protein
MLTPSCPDFEASLGGRRCRHYSDGGGCTLAQHDECIEWRRVNPTARAPTVRRPAPSRAAPRALTADELASFRQVGAEVCVDSPGIGEIWLVPTHTDLPRCELTPEEAAKVADILRTFPGAGVADMRLLPRD